MSKGGQFKSHIYVIIVIFAIVVLVISSMLFLEILKIRHNKKQYNNPKIHKIEDEITIVDRNGVPLFFKVNINSELKWICPYNIPSLSRMLEYINSNITSTSSERNLFLTLDISEIKKISDAFSKYKNETHIIVLNRYTGEVTTIFDTQKKDKTFYDLDYSVNDLTTSDITKAYFAYVFYKTNPKLITNYICYGDSHCDTSHGNVTIDNLAKCKTAIDYYLTVYSSHGYNIVDLMEENNIFNQRFIGLITGYLSILNDSDFTEIHMINGISYNDARMIKEDYVTIKTNNTKEEDKEYFLKQIEISSDNQKIFSVGDYIVYLETDPLLLESAVKTLLSILE